MMHLKRSLTSGPYSITIYSLKKVCKFPQKVIGLSGLHRFKKVTSIKKNLDKESNSPFAPPHLPPDIQLPLSSVD